MFIRRMKAAGALVRPKGRTVNSKLPKLGLKAVLCMSAGSRRAWW